MAESKRVQVVVAPEIYDYLAKRSKNEGRRPANLAAWLLTRAVEDELKSMSETVESASEA
jgi:hypothetical protein